MFGKSRGVKRIFNIFRKKEVAHLRHDKNCLNCGFVVEERYCSRCGQENADPRESIGHLIGHFLGDITHFDSKIFITIKDLVWRPGFLTREYAEGRRVRYLNPIRMYVFISAIFFVALFAGGEGSEDHIKGDTRAVNEYRRQLADSLRVAHPDSLRRAFNAQLAARLDSAIRDTNESVTLNYGSGGRVLIDIVENKYYSIAAYDSAQRKLPDSARDDATMRWVIHNDIRQRIKHGGEGRMHLEVNIQHDIPKIMFILLPLFALYVGWFYRAKKYCYVNHAIFSVHFHSFLFLFFLFLMLVGIFIPDAWGTQVLFAILTKGWVGLLLVLLFPLPVFIYLVIALRRMYGQSVGMSVAKGLAISLLYCITLCVASTSLLVLALTRI